MHMSGSVSRVAGFFVVLALTVVASACSKDPQVLKQQHFERGRQYIAEKKYNEAIIELRNAVQIDGRFGEARYQLAEVYAQLGDIENASREYVRAADLLPDASVQLKVGSLLLLGGHNEEAKARAERVLEQNPNSVDAHILLGNALAGMKDFDGAVEQMQQAIKNDPTPGLSYASLGNFELQRGNRPEADAAYAKAIDLDPSSAPARVALGNYRLATGDRAGAEQAFLKAVELDSRSIVALKSLVALYLTSRQLGKAEPFLVTLTEESKDSTPSFVLADVYATTGRTDLALARLQTLQKNPADFVPATLRLAALRYAVGRTGEGHADVDEAIKAAPKLPQGYVMRARFLIAEQKLDEAVTELNTAIAAAPEYPLAYFWLGHTYLRQSKPAEARTAFTEAQKLAPAFVPAQIALSAANLQLRDTAGALTFATQAVKTAPGDVDARVALVRALIAQSNVTRAETELKPLVDDHGDLAVVHVLQGAIETLRRDPRSAERAFARALAIDPKSYDALSGLVSTQLATGNVEAAQARVGEAVAQAPRDATTLLIAARAHVAAHDYASAEGALRKAVEVDPQRIDAYTMLGRLYATQNRLGEALREFEEIAKRQPKSVSAHTAVATLQLALNRRAEAKARYQQVLEIDPNAAVAANNLAWMQAEDGDNLDEALQLAQTAVSRLPNSAEVVDTLGFVYHKKSLFPQAIAAFQRCIKLDARNPIYHYHLGLAYAESGDTTEAKRSLDSALTLSSSFPGADDARATRATLR
jgi:putative PEP-CTERM system TPR-repeat lipoprotein